MQRTWCLALGAVAVVLAVSGCGGSSSSPAESWASDVCSSVSTWKTSVQQITTDAANAIAKPGSTREDATNAVQKGVDATQKLVDDLKGLEAPDTPEGAQAKKDLDTFATDTQQTIDGVKSALAGIPSGAGLAEIVTQLSGQASTLQQAIASGQQLVTSLQNLGGDLKDGFEQADSCKDLRSGS